MLRATSATLMLATALDVTTSTFRLKSFSRNTQSPTGCGLVAQVPK